MADNAFRSYRSRDSIAREDIDSAGDDAGDPLAELARLIGQSDPRGEARHERYAGDAPDDAAAPGLDWAADESYPPEHARDDDRYAPPLADSQSYQQQQDRGYANEPAVGDRFFSRSAARSGGFRQEAGDDPAADDTGYQDEMEPGSQRSADDRYGADHRQYDDADAYAAEPYRDAPPSRRRGGLVVVMAVLALAVLGTAGAFGYRAMFGGSVLPTLPPIIKPANGPNKIVPNYGDAQAGNSIQGAGDASSSEKLVSHEEQPVEMPEAPRPAPRVVSTIPIAPNQGMAPSGMSAPPAPFNGAPAGAAPPAQMAPAPAPPSGSAAQMPAPPPAAAPPGPKRVHTVTIRADQPAGGDAAAAPAAPRTAAPAPRPKAAAGGSQPLSLVPGQQSEAPAPAPPRTHAAAPAPAPVAVAAAAPAPAAEAASPSGGGYSVQVTSQRSEADAQSAFRALQAKFPNQLGGREPLVRRADLGAKGTYYRALVGPFASAEEAAGMCSSLKAAGGNCLVQRN
jgi:hypothetical protein